MLVWTVVGIVLQVAMVVIGHVNPELRNFWGPGGMAISLAVGCLAARSAQPTWGSVVTTGAVTGGAGALIGIVIAYALGDVSMMLIVLGTLSSVVAGIVGSAIVAVATHKFAKG